MNNLYAIGPRRQFIRQLKNNMSLSLTTPPKLWSAERKLLLGFGDIITICAALAASILLQNKLGFASASLFQPHWFALLIVLWLGVGLAFDIYHLVVAASPMRSIWSAVSAALIIAVIFFFIPYATPALPGRRIAFLFFPLLMGVGISIWRYTYATTISRSAYYEPVLIIGAGWAGRTLAKTLLPSSSTGGTQINPAVGYQVLGFIDDDPAVGKNVDGIPVLGTAKQLKQIVMEKDPAQIVLSITHSEKMQPEMFQAILECRTLGVPITSMAALYERSTGKIPLEQAGHNLGAILSSAESGFSRLYSLLMRTIDILIGLQGCLFTGILVPFIWMINLRSGPGPVFYQQERVGKAGKSFKIFKFRSMIVDAEKFSGAVWADEDDPRITPAGRFFRKTRLDEIPQFWNILKGDMSLIGPRPERPQFVDLLSEEIPLYPTRHAIKPGLTGWAQVMYRYGASVDDSRIKLQYDLFYIKHQGIYLDLKILLKTVGVVLGFKGR